MKTLADTGSFEEFAKKPESLWKYRYPSESELQELSPAVQHIFNTVQEREEDGKTVLFRLGDPAGTFAERQAAAVENRGTVMPGLNEASVEVVDVPKHGYKGTAMQAKAQAVEDAKARYTGTDGKPKIQHYDNFGQEFDYTISSGSIAESVNPKAQKKSTNIGVHIAVLNHLPEVIGQSIEAEEHPDYMKDANGVRTEKRVNPDVLIHRFFGAVNIDGVVYRVKTTMKESRDENIGNSQYTYEVTKIEVLTSNEPASTPNGMDSIRSEEIVCPLAKLLDGVEKSYDSGKKLLDESTSSDTRQRPGDGPYTDSEVSYENDPRAKFVGRPVRTKKQQAEFAARERRRMLDTARELAKKLGIASEVEIRQDASGLTGRMASAKGWFDPKTGKIVVIASNHASAEDIAATILHEGVAHYGLRKLFGTHFDTFLDNVYRNAEEGIRRKIAAMAARNGWDFRTATEEYLASLAEDTNFEHVGYSWWSKIKRFFIDMLHDLGLPGFESSETLTDNELRYILWRSYRNLTTDGGRNGLFGVAEDIAMQHRLQVGNYAPQTDSGGRVAESRGSLDAVNERFNEELEEQINGTLPESHVYQLGLPSAYLRSTGIPNLPIQMRSSRLYDKATGYGHDFNLDEVRNLVLALQNPLAIFAYGNKEKAQNIIVELSSRGKNFIVGLSLNPEVDGRHLEINSIRNVFPKDNAEWLNWITQDKMLREDKKKIQALIEQQRTSLADVPYLDLDLVAKIVERFENPPLPTDNFSSSDESDSSGLLFRSTIEEPEDGVARNYYERRVREPNRGGSVKRGENLMWRLHKEYIDSMSALQAFTDGVLKETGGALSSGEDAYKAENAMSSKNKAQTEVYDRDFFSPLLDAVDRLIKAGVDYDEVKRYMVAKHGLERNTVLARRDAEAQFAEELEQAQRALERFEQAHANDPAALDGQEHDDLQEAVDNVLQNIEEAYEANRERDYSGLTGLTGQDNVTDAEAAAQAMVDGMEARHGALCNALWRRINAATGETLRYAYNSGLMDKDTYERVEGAALFFFVCVCLGADYKIRLNKKGRSGLKGHKKRAPLSPTFVNLKSNTMKNTMQR